MIRESERGRRCFVCAAAMLAPSDRRLIDARGRGRVFATAFFATACNSCGVLTERDADPAGNWRDLAGRRAVPTFVSDPDGAYGLDIYTLRTAATRLGRLAPTIVRRSWRLTARSRRGPNSTISRRGRPSPSASWTSYRPWMSASPGGPIRRSPPPPGRSASS